MAKAPSYIRGRLNDIEDAIKALTDPNSNCAIEIPDELRDRIKNYLDAWVLSRLEVVERWSKGEDLSYSEKR